ncbi:MAG: hypothetical protein H7A33_04260 [Deltaproteobacteria bacterium]|nr:hypothetical protein [Deltaproteobacteria bacterium]
MFVRVLKNHLLVMLILLCVPFIAHAGGPFIVTDDGEAATWDNTSAISYHPEDGTCGDFSNETMLTKLSTSLLVWSGIDEVDITFTQVQGAIGQVNVDNYEDYLYLTSASSSSLLTDNINPVVFDDDGEITAEVAGSGNQYFVLGFAGPAGFSDGGATIVDGQAVLNCLCLESSTRSPCYVNGNQSVIEVTEDELEFTIVHEMGHFLNLDHSQVNKTLFNNSVASDDERIPIMFPIATDTDASLVATTDDKASLASLYPSDQLDAGWCFVTGTLLDSDGNELACADVWAVPSSDTQIVSAVSGAYLVGSDANDDSDRVDDGECTDDCGYFQMYLPEGQEYDITVNAITSSFVGGSSVGPCVNGQLTTIEEETVATVTSLQCTAGSTINLGTISTSSTGGSSSSDSDDSGSSGSSGGAGSGGDSSQRNDDLNPVGYWCSLTPGVEPASFASLFALFSLPLLFIYFMRRRNSES